MKSLGSFYICFTHFKCLACSVFEGMSALTCLRKKAVLLGGLWIVPVGKEGQGSSGRKDVLGSRVNTVIFCAWSKYNKKIPTDSDVPQIRHPSLGYLLWGWEGEINLVNLCLRDLLLLPDAVLKMSFHPGAHLIYLILILESERLAGRHPLDLPLPILSQGQAGLSQRPAHYTCSSSSVDASAGCWYVAWEITRLLNLFSKPLPPMNHARPVFIICVKACD